MRSQFILSRGGKIGRPPTVDGGIVDNRWINGADVVSKSH